MSITLGAGGGGGGEGDNKKGVLARNVKLWRTAVLFRGELVVNQCGSENMSKSWLLICKQKFDI